MAEKQQDARETPRQSQSRRASSFARCAHGCVQPVQLATQCCLRLGVGLGTAGVGRDDATACCCDVQVRCVVWVQPQVVTHTFAGAFRQILRHARPSGEPGRARQATPSPETMHAIMRGPQQTATRKKKREKKRERWGPLPTSYAKSGATHRRRWLGSRGGGGNLLHEVV